MRFLIKIAAVALAVWVTTMIVPGIQVSGGLRNYLVNEILNQDCRCGISRVGDHNDCAWNSSFRRTA